MIEQDLVSQFLSIVSLLIIVYLSTFQPSSIILFPAILLIAGIVMQFYLLKRYEMDWTLESEEAHNIVYYTLFGLIIIAIGSIISPRIMIPKLDVTGYDAILYSIMIAVAEEQFFRGALLNFFLQSTPAFGSMLAIIASAFIFMVYHFAVYRTSYNNLLYVLIAGIALAYIDYQAQRVSPSMIAHIINNILAWVV
jgi:membrane protease YdiL (CAAX protease family)